MQKQKNARKSTHPTHKSRASDVLDELRAFRLHASDNAGIVQAFFIALDTPVSLSCYLLYKYEEFEQLVNKDVSPSDYDNPSAFRDDFAAVSFLRKSASLKTNIDKQEVAYSAFFNAEQKCKESNLRIKSYLRTGKSYPGGEAVISTVIRKIERILGSFDVDEMLEHCNWGPGVTQLVKGSDTSASKKFDVEREITLDAYDLFGDVLKQLAPEIWANRHVHFKRGNVIITVPKNAKTDRTIAVEPGLNTWLQLGAGKVIRKRLRAAGFNLNSDLKNQRGAYIGSLDDSLATIDFKAASDTISKEVVRLLISDNRWFAVLDGLRSKYFTINNGPNAGKTLLNEKFSTMGNGFTFELESLIFVSIALALCEIHDVSTDNVSIFGDDLVLPSCLVPELVRAVEFLGFTVNSEKSFSRGPFRESCGSYYFDGVDVKPIFLKKDLVYAKDIYRLANAISSLSHRFNSCWSRDGRFRSMHSLLVHRLPLKLRFFGPVASGDATIHVNVEDSIAQRAHGGLEGFTYSGLPEVPKCIEKHSIGVMFAKLWTPSTDADGNRIPLRGRTRTILKRNMLVHLWYNFGPWI